MSTQYIFTMYRLNRVHPPDKHVLKDVTLAFLPGAKIGVLGPNGAGKSSLLRIMAGVDTGFTGDAMLAPGATVGLLEQEPELDESKDVRGNVEDGLAESLQTVDVVVRRFRRLEAEVLGDPVQPPGERGVLAVHPAVRRDAGGRVEPLLALVEAHAGDQQPADAGDGHAVARPLDALVVVVRPVAGVP